MKNKHVKAKEREISQYFLSCIETKQSRFQSEKSLQSSTFPSIQSFP